MSASPGTAAGLAAPGAPPGHQTAPAPWAGGSLTREFTLAGARQRVDLFVPAGTGPAPLVVIAHGFSRHRGTMRGWGTRLSAEGYLVAVPDLPAWADHHRNGRALNELVRQLEAGGAGRAVDTTREALVGFSAGGLATLLAAAANPGIAVWVGLDPVDRGGSGAAAAAALSAPAVLITAEPAACNARGNAAAMTAALPGGWLSLAVAGASHCDAESPGSALCGLACAGSWDAERHAAFAEYTTAALDAVLRCRPAAWARLAAARDDRRLGSVRGPGLDAARGRCADVRP